MSDVSYQRMRETLISLQVDLDDKEKVCEQLQQKIDIERVKLGRIEADATAEYEHILQTELQAGQLEAQRLRDRLEKLMSAKKALAIECQQKVESVKDKDSDQAAERRNVYRKLTEDLEEERRAFRRGHQQRLSKFLNARALEEKESTNRALGPEFARLRQQHELELSEVEAEAVQQERRLRAEAQQRADEMLQEERNAHLDAKTTVSRSRVGAVQAELDGACVYVYVLVHV